MTNGELGRRLLDLSSQMAQGFAGVNVRLDRVNGRLDTQGNTIAAHAVKIAEQAVLASGHADSVHTLRQELDKLDDGHRVLESESESDSKAITRRDVAIAVAAIIGTVAVVEWLPKLLTAVAP